jgi:hypothetical protein
MAPLKSVRQERFCQLVKRGIPPIRAYPMAGYKPHESAPARLCGNVRIKQRLAELTREFAVKTRVTVASMSEEFDEIKTAAMADKQYAAAKGAADSKAKLHGLMIERKEHGNAGEFAGLTSVEDILAKAREELGDDAADALMAILDKSDYPGSTHPESDRAKPSVTH